MTLRKCLMSFSVALLLPVVANAAFSVSAPNSTVPAGVVQVPITVSSSSPAANIDAMSVAFIVKSVSGNTGSGKLVNFSAPSASTIWTNPGVGTQTLNLDVSSPIIDFNGTNSRSVASISNGGGSVGANGVAGYIELDLSSANPGDMFLIDIQDQPFTKASLGDVGIPNIATIDGKLSVAIPEPSSFALVGLVGIGIAGNWYRKKRLAKAAAAE